MLQEKPYSEMKKNKQGYEIMLLRDQKGSTYAAIAQAYAMSIGKARQMYNKQKIKQIRLYIHRIARVLGRQTTAEINKVFIEVWNCYEDLACACAYMEKKYKEILTEYRKGEPGMPEAFIQALPPFKQKLSQKEVERVIEMREKEKASFKQIGKALRITQAKAKDTYDLYYHTQILQMVEALQEQAESNKEKMEIEHLCFHNNYSSKKRYDMLLAHSASMNRKNKDK